MLAGYYKIKLKKQGFRLVYGVQDDILVVMVIAPKRVPSCNGLKLTATALQNDSGQLYAIATTERACTAP